MVAIGNPFGLGGTVTAGIISARNRDISLGRYDDFIQTDAAINVGNSGGPLFNLKGEVVGINSAILSNSGGSVGIGFAIPSNLAKNVIDQIINTGEIKRGYIGVRIQEVTKEIADSLGLKNPEGALISSAATEGPANKAGIQAGDVILEFNNIKVENYRRLQKIVAETPIGKNVDVKIWRNKKIITRNIKVARLEETVERLIPGCVWRTFSATSSGVACPNARTAESTNSRCGVKHDGFGVRVLLCKVGGIEATQG